MKHFLSLALLTAMCTTAAMAQEPVISTKYTADPAPYVHGDPIGKQIGRASCRERV